MTVQTLYKNSHTNIQLHMWCTVVDTVPLESSSIRSAFGVLSKNCSCAIVRRLLRGGDCSCHGERPYSRRWLNCASDSSRRPRALSTEYRVRTLYTVLVVLTPSLSDVLRWSSISAGSGGISSSTPLCQSTSPPNTKVSLSKHGTTSMDAVSSNCVHFTCNRARLDHPERKCSLPDATCVC